MSSKITTDEKDKTKADMPFAPKDNIHEEDVELNKKIVHQRFKSPRSVKLPRLKLAVLVSQVSEENAHNEISIGQSVGNEVC